MCWSPEPLPAASRPAESAIGVLAAFARAGVAVPGRVSVVGYDDTPSRLSCFNSPRSVKAPGSRWGMP
ncbi:predicted protein [Streptomyces viridochromogenes DSM 40736]|uniref:Predicted protein n=1 Tax=Streptomyces viridochromogenes (strain DSM 40736 / JCM 4977 / BCRC 1201 / Tue 494) TaxID=591159 RepID=D9XBM5_STRVT|nr:predicted protein [Streptomyces viridochromogenes DSM 40736]